MGTAAQQTFTLTVHEKPLITSDDSATFDVGEPGSFTVTTTGLPQAVITVQGALPAGITLVDNGNGIATLGGTPTTNGSTTFQLTATNSVGSDTQQFTLDVRDLPTFTSDGSTTFTVGTFGTFTVTTAGFPVAELTIDEDHLPPGVSFTDNDDGTGTLEGTPQSPGGVSELTLTATNLAGSKDLPFTLTVNEAPSITSDDEVTFVRGEAGSFTVTTDGFPVAELTIDEDHLPPGVSFTDNDDGTATISGTPTGEPGSVTVSLLADNNVEPDATQTLTVVVQEKPAFTSAASASFVAGTSGSFTLTTTGDPVPELTVDGVVPPGLTFTDQSDGTATLAGTPTAAGVADLVVTASNDAGSVEQALTVRIDPAPVPPTPPGPGITPTPPGPGVTPTATCLGALATVVGGTGDVVITGTPGNDVIVGGPATTKILGGGGDDVLCAVAGAEVSGGAGDDVLRGGPGDDRLLAGPGNDVVSTWGGLDIVLGGAGGDAINGNWGDDKVWGQSGDDELSGRRGEDLLLGGRGDDEVLGGRGPDQLYGGPDSDRCQGGLGPDTAQQCEVESGVPRVMPEGPAQVRRLARSPLVSGHEPSVQDRRPAARGGAVRAVAGVPRPGSPGRGRRVRLPVGR